MRLLVTGGRNFNNSPVVNAALRLLHERYGIEHVIHGACPSGADHLAHNWATFEPGVTVKGCPADWDNIDHPKCRIKINRRGKAYNALAGFNRNGEMITNEKPTHCLAFPGGPGTLDMVGRARRNGIEVIFAVELLRETV